MRCGCTGHKKENASEQERVKDSVVTEKRLWELHRLLNNRKGSLSSRGEQQGVRPQSEKGGSIGSSGRGVPDVRGHVGHRGKGVLLRATLLFASEEDAMDKLEAARQHQDHT